jgi:hypothetical protein
MAVGEAVAVPAEPGGVQRYVAPSVVGLAGLGAVAVGNAYPWLIASAGVFAATLLILARSLVAVGITLLAVVIAGGVALWLPSAAGAICVALCTVWLVGGARSSLEHTRQNGLDRTDSAAIHAELGIPARAVAFFQFALTLVAVGVAVWVGGLVYL